MANPISVLLSLKDRFTQPVKKTVEETKKMERQIKQASNTIKKFGNQANDVFKKVAKGAAVGLGGALAGGTALGFKEAFDLGGYRLQLETATKDTKIAADIM